MPNGPVACLVPNATAPNPVEPVEPASRIAFARSRGRRALQRYLAEKFAEQNSQSDRLPQSRQIALLP
ncbi:hypothetical protein BTN_2751 [Burkholderia thailandensis E254]|uniref:hypothetical protein n=1 Tax=Burkholderia thailandensis TaxID=57975 RepID=UPI000517B7C7|nr:hypothetical protein [Burkholderia thailandensis]AIT20392.1 hypothetical protein BTN_2751 [Burkholderia thailandensis E254]MCS6504356.1 hypothetical protein [Burkholderia thailandensis]NOK49124.1 hypothetical protein [Burkholderia thailandensis]